MEWYCEICRHYAVEVVGRDVSARLELDRMREGHKAWHRMIAAEAHGVTLDVIA